LSAVHFDSLNLFFGLQRFRGNPIAPRVTGFQLWGRFHVIALRFAPYSGIKSPASSMLPEIENQEAIVLHLSMAFPGRYW